jgi:hypothetical protein
MFFIKRANSIVEILSKYALTLSRPTFGWCPEKGLLQWLHDVFYPSGVYSHGLEYAFNADNLLPFQAEKMLFFKWRKKIAVKITVTAGYGFGGRYK